MYKDVKKKLLSVALCICMIIGLVQVVPKAKAAVQATQTIKVMYAGELKDVEVAYSFDQDVRYNGQPQVPHDINVRRLDGSTPANVSSSFTFRYKSSDPNNTAYTDNPTNADTYTAYLVSTDAAYTVPDGNGEITNTYTIHQAVLKPSDCQFTCSNTVAIKNSSGIEPELSTAILKTERGAKINLNDPDQSYYHKYTVEKVTTTGWPVVTADGDDLMVTVDDTVKRNFSNPDAFDGLRVRCNAGYDLSGNDKYEVVFLDANDQRLEQADYTGGPITLRAGIFDKETNTLVARLDRSSFKIEPASVTDIGDYPITVTPQSGEKDIASAESLTNPGSVEYFTGCYSGTFKVKGYDPKDLKVYVKNPNGEGSIDLNHPTSRPVWKYKGSNQSVIPEIIDVEDANGKRYYEGTDFTVVEDYNTTGVGGAGIHLEFNNISTYEGPLPLTYYIYSELEIERIGFEGYGSFKAEDDINLYYTGEVLLPEGQDGIIVNAESGIKLEKGTHYTVSYSYQNSSGWHELTADAAKNDPNMAKPGPKRIVITGIGIFERAVPVVKNFNVAAVNIAEHERWFTVSFKNGQSVYTYNKEPQRPEMIVTYVNDFVKPALPPQDVTKEFTVSYQNNESAGTATVILEANGGFIGTLTAEFTIEPLSLSGAECVNDGNTPANQYIYTGNAIKPALKIGELGLEEHTDYEIEYYADSSGSHISGVPVQPGDYTMHIKEGTNSKNIQGSKDIHYQIVSRDISSSTDISFRLERDTYEWEGGVTEPEVICGGSLNLVEGKDYTVSYNNNSAPTTDAKVTITGMAPNLQGTKTLTFTITQRRIDNPNIVVTPSAVAVNNGYNVTLNVRDLGNSVVKKQLEEGTDYKIESIVYVTENEFKDVTCSALTALPYAGEYEITLKGINNYQDTRTVTAKCGTDITDAKVTINKYTDIIYNGKEQFPDITVMWNGKQETLSQGQADGPFIPLFTRNDPEEHYGREGIDAGTVYVQAQGNPEQGYYGVTSQKASYTIKQRELSDVYVLNFSDAAINDGKAYYNFTNKPVTPKLVVSKGAITTIEGSFRDSLVAGLDYEIKYGYDGNDERIISGPHAVIVNGIGNFTGELASTFYIEAMGINSPTINATFLNTVTTYAEEAPPTLVLSLGGQNLTEGVDYAVDIRQEDRGNESAPQAGWKNTYVYYVTGLGNFAKTSREETFEITPTTIQPAKDPSNPKPGETYISEWDYTELMVKPSDTTVNQPTGFTLSYVKKDGSSYILKYGVDFEVEEFTTNKQPGPNSQITIVGKGGCNGRLTNKVTLYTDIGDAKFLMDATGTEHVGTLYEGATVSSKDLKDAIDSNTLSDLIRFVPIWTSVGGSGWIDPSCYTVTLSCGDTPRIGSVTVTVSGEKEKYYAGAQSFTIKVTGSLEGNVDRVVIGNNNAVAWNEQPVTPDMVKVEVWSSDNKLLKGGYVSTDDVNNNNIPADYDYMVTFEDNSGVGLAKAIITGVNKYSGELIQPFKITYPMSQLTIEIQNKEGVWEEYKGGASYLYEIDTNRNQPRIRLLYPTGKDSAGKDTFDIVKEDCYSVSYSGYEKAGPAKAIIGEPESDDYKGILLGTGRVVDYTLEQIDLKNVTIVMSNPNQMYTGLEKNATDLGLKVSYNGHDLGDADYTLLFRNATNTDQVDGVKATVTITGKGSFTGSVTEEFSISPLPLSNTEYINATAEQIIYTGRQETPKLTISQVLGYLRTLREGDDYEIAGYTDETKSTRRETPFTEIGTYYVVVQGLRNYASTTDPYCYIKYEIVKREMDDGLEMTFISSDSCPVINGEPQCIYNGKPHQPNVYVTFNGVELRGPSQTNPQYDLRYEDNLNAGTATVTVTGTGSFNGEKSMTFTIAPKDISYEDIEYRDGRGSIFADEQEFPWLNNNVPVHPEIIVYDKSLQTQLVNGESADYRIDYQDDSDGTQTNAGEVLMTIVGQNNYIGSKKFTYFIGEDISKSYVLVNGQKSLSTTYNGLTQAPREADISVVWNSDMSQEDENGEKRYKIAYYYYEQGSTDRFDLTHRVNRDQMVNAGTYYIAVVGEPTKGTYAKSDARNSCAYTINPRSIAPSYILVSGYDATYYYTGQAIEPKAIAVEDTDLPVTGEVNDPQRRSVKLISGTDYDLSYLNNTAAGKASIIVAGKGNYTGNRVAYFNILSSNADGNNTWDGSSEGTGSISNGSTTIAASDIILGYDNSQYNCMMYNGYERIPTVTINGISTNEFIITASNNIRPGVATLMITGRGNNYTGTIIKNYNIKANLAAYGSIAAIEDQVYTGYQITPHVTLTCGGNVLNQGSDYTLTYLNNTNIGRATVMATATNDSYYIGTANGGFNISNTAGGMEITGYASSYTYTGYAITPDVVVTMNGRVLNRGTDYMVSYSNNTNVGTASMTVTGIGSFSGTKTINYTIEAKNIENCLTTAVNNYQYTGGTYTPNISVTDSSTGKTLVAGTDYTITYSNNTNPGTASITVTALSKNYSGSKVIPFKILSAAVSGLRTSSIKNNSIKLAWTPQDYADGYQICNSSNRVIATTSKNSYTIKGLTSCTTYRFKVRSYVENADGSISYGGFSTAVSAKTLLNTPKLKAVSTSKGRVTLTWSKVAKATGYEIYYSTKKNGVYTRLKTVSKSSSRKYVDRGLASGERYYYTIRAYRTTNGVKTYSSYNTIKSVKVK